MCASGASTGLCGGQRVIAVPTATTVPIPPFVKVAIDAWTAAAGLSEGPLFRRVRRRKYSEKTPVALSERMIWHIVTKYARQTGIVISLPPMI